MGYDDDDSEDRGFRPMGNDDGFFIIRRLKKPEEEEDG